jgi:hypothetical protein
MRTPTATATRLGRWLSALLLALGLGTVLAFAFVTLRSRPLDGSEGHILYDAMRLRAGRALYVDPHLGILDDGPPPARHYVIYTPLLAFLVALFPETAAPWMTRLLAIAAWYGLLAGLAATRTRIANAWLAWSAAAFVGAVYVLTLYGASGRPDSLALLFAGIAFARSVRRGHPTPLDGALFALAAWVKPNVLALAAATLAIDLLRRRKLGPAAAGALVSVIAGGTLMLVSHGAFLQHLVEPIKAPMTLSLALDQATSRLPFLGVPLLAAALVAARARSQAALHDQPQLRDGATLALGALVAAFVWTLVSLAKYGSASNYWMEPCVALVVIATSLPLPALGDRAALALLGVAIFQLVWTLTASVRSSVESIVRAPYVSAEIAKVREVCGARPGETVMADDSGLELMIDHRLFHAPVQLTPLVAYGRWSEDAFLEDVRRPEVTCAVMTSDLLERPLTEVDRDHDLYDPTLRAALRDRFLLVDHRAGLWVYALRSRASAGTSYPEAR